MKLLQSLERRQQYLQYSSYTQQFQILMEEEELTPISVSFFFFSDILLRYNIPLVQFQLVPALVDGTNRIKSI